MPFLRFKINPERVENWKHHLRFIRLESVEIERQTEAGDCRCLLRPITRHNYHTLVIAVPCVCDGCSRFGVNAWYRKHPRASPPVPFSFGLSARVDVRDGKNIALSLQHELHGKLYAYTCQFDRIGSWIESPRDGGSVLAGVLYTGFVPDFRIHE